MSANVTIKVSGSLSEGDVLAVRPAWRAGSGQYAQPDMCTLTIDLRGGASAEIRVRIVDVQAAIQAVLEAKP